MLSLAALVVTLTTPADSTAVIRCDDGSPAWTSLGRPNLKCRIRGCGPSDAYCPPRGCLDEVDGVCEDETVEPVACEGILKCFGSWLSCTRGFLCQAPTWYGACEEGTCGGE